MPLSAGWSIALVVASLLLTSVATASLFFVQIDRQVDRAKMHLDTGVEQLRKLAEQSPTVRSVVLSVPFVSEAIGEVRPHRDGDASAGSEQEAAQEQRGESSNAAKDESESLSGGARPDGLPEPIKQAANAIGRVFATTFGLIVNSMLIFFVGLFLAISPATYRDGFVQLVRPDKRERATEVMNEIGDTLWRWLVGRFGSMLVTGVGAATLLWLIGVPMAGALGVVTGLLTFIPNIGAAIALSLAVLFALPKGTAAASMVLPAYLMLQLIESYVVTPLIQKRQVSIPPALLIAFQAVMGVLFGILGAAVASPLLAAAKVAIEKLYVEDVLEA